MTRASARGFHFRYERSNARQPETPIKPTRLTFRAFKLLYPCNGNPWQPPPSARIRFNHRIALANEKDWLVTGAKGSLIVGRCPQRYFCNDRSENASRLVHRHWKQRYPRAEICLIRTRAGLNVKKIPPRYPNVRILCSGRCMRNRAATLSLSLETSCVSAIQNVR